MDMRCSSAIVAIRFAGECCSARREGEKEGHRDRCGELVGEREGKGPDKTGYQIHLPLNDSEQAECRFSPI